jgi:hypothetical protein
MPRNPNINITYDELEELVAYRKNVTGISHTIFISPKGNARHRPRLTLAIDPPDSIDPRGATATIRFDGSIAAGNIDADLLAQIHRFIELNRQVLLDYWHYRIDGRELDRRLKPLKGE